ncbi:MAG: transketolase family protein [Verrucomicrobiota bacterium]
MRKQFRETMMDLAERDERVTLVFGDISVYLFNTFQQKFPERFYNMGICEATLVSVAAGLSSQGFIPFVHSITPFVTERALEQIKLDFCYNQFPGNIISCGATFDYAWDGATHHGWVDTGAIRLLPGTQVFQPGTPKEFDALLRSQYAIGKTSYYRTSDHAHGVEISENIQAGKGIILKNTGAKLTVITAGPILKNVFEACADLPVNLLYFHTLKPFDHELVSQFSNTTLAVVHDTHGLHEAVCETANRSVFKLGLPDAFCCSYGKIDDARNFAGLSIASIKEFLIKIKGLCP